MKKLFLLLTLVALVSAYPTSGGVMGGGDISDSLGNTNELTLGSSTDSAGYFIMLGRDSLYYDTFTGQWYLSAPLSVIGVLDAYYGFFDSLKAATHVYFGYTADSAFYVIYGLRDTVVDYDTIGGAKLKVETATIGDDLYVVDSAFFNAVVDSGVHNFLDNVWFKGSTFHGGAVVDSGNHVVLGDLMVSGEATYGIEEIIQASTDDLTAAEVKSTLINNYGQGEVNTQTLPTAAEGLNCQFVLITIGNAFHVDVQATDKFYLDGVALDDGDKISCATPAVGDAISIMAVQNGASSYDWIARTIQGTWIDGG